MADNQEPQNAHAGGGPIRAGRAASPDRLQRARLGAGNAPGLSARVRPLVPNDERRRWRGAGAPLAPPPIVVAEGQQQEGQHAQPVAPDAPDAPAAPAAQGVAPAPADQRNVGVIVEAPPAPPIVRIIRNLVPLEAAGPPQAPQDAPPPPEEAPARMRLLNPHARPRRVNPIAQKQFIRYQMLEHGSTPNKHLVLIRSGNLEVYMHKHKTTGQIVPCKYDRCLPESQRLKLPSGMTNNFALWTADDVLRWARKFIIPQNDLDTLALYRYTGLDIFYITRRQHHGGALYFKKLSPEATTQMMIEPPVAPANLEPLSPRIMDALGRNMNKIFNLLHGFH